MTKIHPQGRALPKCSCMHGGYFRASNQRRRFATKQSPARPAYINGNHAPAPRQRRRRHLRANLLRTTATRYASRLHSLHPPRQARPQHSANQRSHRFARFDLEEAIEKSGVDFLLVTSDPPAFAERGKKFTYSLVVKSKKGGVKVKLESGPDGMKLNGTRDLIWDVPENWNERNPTIITTVSDSSGQELFHTFDLSVVDKLPEGVVLPAPVREDPKKDIDPKKEDIVKETEPKKLPPRGPNPFDIVPPTFGNSTTVNLPGAVTESSAGGGGRFLLFGLPSVQKIALFDVNEAKVVHYFPTAGGTFHFAASMSKLIVAYPDTQILQRWDLLTRERDVSVKMPVEHDVHMVSPAPRWTATCFRCRRLLQPRKNGRSFVDVDLQARGHPGCAASRVRHRHDACPPTAR